MVEQGAVNSKVAGSSPAATDAEIAQLAELPLCKRMVEGSIPFLGSILSGISIYPEGVSCHSEWKICSRLSSADGQGRF